MKEKTCEKFSSQQCLFGWVSARRGSVGKPGLCVPSYISKTPTIQKLKLLRKDFFPPHLLFPHSWPQGISPWEERGS